MARVRDISKGRKGNSGSSNKSEERGERVRYDSSRGGVAVLR